MYDQKRVIFMPTAASVIFVVCLGSSFSAIDFAYKRITSALVKYFITRTNNEMRG